MDFSLNNEQIAIRDTALNFRKRAILPRVEEFDKSSMPYPAEWIQTANELGFSSLVIPSSLGGVGAGTLTAGIVLEELAAGCAGFATALLGIYSAVLAVLLCDNRKKAQELLVEDMETSGRNWRASLCGFPFSPFERNANGEVDGRAYGVIGIGCSSWYAVLVREASATKCYIIRDKSPVFTMEPFSAPLGLRSATLGKMSVKNWRPTEEEKVGEIEMNRLLALVAPLQGCVAVGCARGAIDAAESYARERYQGGDIIIKHDAVAHLVLSNKARINSARASLWKVLTQNDDLLDKESGALMGNPNLEEAVLSRVFATDCALQAALDAVQCFGGYGYMRDFPVEKRLRDARSIGTIMGTTPELLSHIKFTLEDA